MCNCAKVDSFAGDCCSHKKFDPTKPVQTRDGRKARIICTDRIGVYPIVALFEMCKGGEETTGHYDINGKIYGQRCDSITDLVNVPEQVVLYVNMHTNTCLKKHTMNVIGRESDFSVNGFSTVKLTFEEGKLLSSEVVR